MKLTFSLFFILFINFGYAQNIKKIIDKNDINALQKYIDNNETIYPEIHFHTEDYEISPLVYAARKERIAILKILINNKNKFDTFNFDLSLAFAESVITKNDELITYLYNLNPNINEIVPYYNDKNAIMLCANYGNEKWYFKLKKLAILTLTDKYSNNLLHITINSVNFNNKIFNDVVNIKSLDINEVNYFNRTPLQTAIKVGNYSAFKIILNKGGEQKNVEQKHIDQLYVDAIYGGNINIYNYVLKFVKEFYLWSEYDLLDEEDNYNSYYPLEIALRYNKTEIASQIINKMFDKANEKDSSYEQEIFVEILNSRKMYDDTFWPLHETIANKNKVLFELLLRKIVAFNNTSTVLNKSNDNYDQREKIIFTKFEYRSAKRKFGKDYVEQLYNELKISF